MSNHGVTNQQQAQLEGMAWALCLAAALHWRAVTLVTDSVTTWFQIMGVRAKTRLSRQMRVLCTMA